MNTTMQMKMSPPITLPAIMAANGPELAPCSGAVGAGALELLGPVVKADVIVAVFVIADVEEDGGTVGRFGNSVEAMSGSAVAA